MKSNIELLRSVPVYDEGEGQNDMTVFEDQQEKIRVLQINGVPANFTLPKGHCDPDTIRRAIRDEIYRLEHPNKD